MPPKAQPPASNTSSNGEQASAGASNRSTPAAARPSSASSRGGKPPTAKPKFTGRRSQAARLEAEQAEAKKRETEAAAAAAEARNAAREARQFGYGRGGPGRGRGARGRGRGRGGHMGDRRQQEAAVASGPWSSGQVAADSRRSGGGGGSGGGTSGGVYGSRSSGGRSYGVKMEPGMGDVSAGGMSSRQIKIEDGGYISSDEEGEALGSKQDVDQMQIVDLTGENEDGSPQVIAPVRLARVPHKDRTVGLSLDNATGDSSDEEEAISDKKRGKQRARDVEVTGATQRPKRPTAYSSSDTEGEPYIKKEPTEDEDDATAPASDADNAPMALDAMRDPPSSPESKRKAKENIKALVDDLDDFAIPDEPRFQTQAEKDEWHRRYDDLRDIRDELGLFAPAAAAPQTDAGGDTAMAEETPQALRAKRRQEERENHVYVFQFPPVLPDLAAIQVKDDPEGEDPDTIRADDPTNTHTAQPSDSNENAMDIDKEKEKQKGSTTAESSKSTKKAAADSAPDFAQPKLPSGAVGKLRIHRSGKAVLDWGGTSMVLGKGADASFLQTVLLARMPEKKPPVVKAEGDAAASAPAQEEEDQQVAIGWGMGQIRGKFIMTPNWDEILKGDRKHDDDE